MFERRAIQYDISRGRVPKLSTLFRRLDLLRPWGVDALVLYIECVVETDTFPAAGCGATPVTRDWLRRADAGCRERGVELIPLIQVLGHQANLLALDAFERLGELPPPRNRASGMNNFLPHVPEVRERVKAWLDEVLPCFSSARVHAGCDEIFTLGTGRSRAWIEEHGLEETLADYLGDIHRFLASRGKTMMICPDMMIHFPALRDLLPEDIVVTNWGYGLWPDAYEQDNHHFAMHEFVTSRFRANWVLGNNHAEYVFPPLERLAGNTDIWLDLGSRSRAEGFLITDWGSYWNVNPHVLSVMGDLYVLMRLSRGSVETGEFLRAFALMVLGREDARFVRALDAMLHAQRNPLYFEDERLLKMLPVFPSLMLDDPNAGGRSVRRFACLRPEGMMRFEEDMREAAALLDAVDTSGAAQPDYAHDLRMLSRRLLMTALRARLCQADAWDTGFIWHDARTLAPGRAVLDDYMRLAADDIAWTAKRWDDENLESDKAACVGALAQARESVRRRILDASCVNARSLHSPKPLRRL